MRRLAGPCALAAITGYLALTQEILWFRAISYATGGQPVVFAEVLGVFLAGTASGAFFGERWGRRATSRILFLARTLALGALTYFASIALAAQAFTIANGAGFAAVYAAIFLTATFSGAVLPLLCEMSNTAAEGAPQDSGAVVAWIYAANIAGSTLGPIVTGFLLLNVLPAATLMLYVTVATLFLAATLIVALVRESWPDAVGLVGFATLAALVHGPLYDQLLEKLHFKTDYAHAGVYKHLVENRHGIIAVQASTERLPGHQTDIIFGGGIFDGTFNVDPFADSNLIIRAYMMATLHRQPAKALVIGLSSGSWAAVLASDRRVKALDIVEINPGYLDLMSSYEHQSRLLADPRVRIHVDDGRRWLHRHADETFDFILMNTSFHWREGVTNLLSQEFLELCQAHLRPGGVFYYNSTASDDVKWTATRVFKHVTEFKNFVAASDSAFNLTAEEKRQHLADFSMDTRPVFDFNEPTHRAYVEQLVNVPLPRLEEELVSATEGKSFATITDDNMLTEFKPRDRRWIVSERTWTALWRRAR